MQTQPYLMTLEQEVLINFKKGRCSEIRYYIITISYTVVREAFQDHSSELSFQHFSPHT